MIRNVILYLLLASTLGLIYYDVELSKELRQINAISWKWESMYEDLRETCGVR